MLKGSRCEAAPEALRARRKWALFSNPALAAKAQGARAHAERHRTVRRRLPIQMRRQLRADHYPTGVSGDDAKELGELLESGQSALIVIGESRVEEQLDKALTRAGKSIEKELDADAKEVERELKEAEKESVAG